MTTIDKTGASDAEFRARIAPFEADDALVETLAAEVDQDDAVQCQYQLASLSEWIDAGNAHRDREAVLWGRVAKLTEEAGEATAALIGMTGQNPRKGVTHTSADVVAELLDVAITALGAVEHLTGNKGHAIPALVAKVDAVHVRAALSDGAR